MSERAQPDVPRRGRPRSDKARLAILDAATELLLARGLGGASMDEVANRAGVSKATIYRWWPTKETLAMDALYHEWTERTSPYPDTGSLRDDLLTVLRPWVRLISSRPYAGVIAALIAKARTDPAFADEYLTRFVQPRRDQARPLFERAIERGEISGKASVEVGLDLIYGALYHRLLQGHAPLNDRFIRDVVDTTLEGITTSAAARAPKRAGGVAL